MQKEEVKAFKNELSNYTFYLHQEETLNNSIEFCFHQLSGVRAIDPSKEPIHAMPNKDAEYAIRDKIERYEAKLRLVCDKTTYIKETLDRIETPLREAVIAVYAYHHRIAKEAEKMALSETGLRKRMNKAIEKALID